MRKFIVILLCLAAVGACACKKTVNYYDYVSELRENIYIYSDDEATIKIYCGGRESPYNSDGIRGEMGNCFEIYAYLPAQSGTVNVKIGDISGEMSYLTVKGCYYLSCGDGDPKTDYLDVEINEKSYRAVSVLYDGVITPEQALECAVEYRSEFFAAITENYIFNGEIYIRLLYDDACYYFVGVCNRSGELTCWLIDGATGKIIAEKTL